MIVPTSGGGQAPSQEMPSEANLLMALAEMHKQGRFQVAGDVVPMPKGQMSEEDIAKMHTQRTLGRALGKDNVVPIRPK